MVPLSFTRVGSAVRTKFESFMVTQGTTLSMQTPRPTPVTRGQGAHKGATAGSINMLAVLIWMPVLFVGGTAVAVGFPVAGVTLVAIVLLIHSLLVPRVAIYALVASIPLEWIIVVMPGVTTAAKLVGGLALLVSLPKLLPSLSPARWDPCVKWILVLTLWSLCGVLWADYPGLTLLGSQSLALVWGVPILICLHITTWGEARNVCLVLVLSTVVSSLAFLLSSDLTGIAQTFVQRSGSGLVGAQRGEITFDLNTVGRLFAIGLLTSVYLITVTRGHLRRMGLLIAAIVLSLGILIVKGRAVWLATPAAMIGALLLLRYGRLSVRLSIAGLILMIGSVVFIVAIKFGFVGEGTSQRFFSIFEEGTGAGNRMVLWRAHLSAFFNTGFIGAGLNQTKMTAESLFHVAHNDWLDIAGDLGAIGLICFLGLHIGLGRRIWRLRDVSTRLFCLMIWLFILMAGMTQRDFVRKYYPLAVGMVIVHIRLQERRCRQTVRQTMVTAKRPTLV